MKKNLLKATLLTTAIASSVALTGCKPNTNSSVKSEAGRDAWVIAEINDKDVLFNVDNWTVFDYTHNKGYTSLHFTTKDGNNFIASDYVIFEKKPSKTFYDVEYSEEMMFETTDSEEDSSTVYLKNL